MKDVKESLQSIADTIKDLQESGYKINIQVQEMENDLSRVATVMAFKMMPRGELPIKAYVAVKLNAY